MQITISNRKYDVRAIRCQTCPAGTAYWQLALCAAGEPGALYAEQTGAIYGQPDLLAFCERAKVALPMRLAELESA